MGHWFRPRSPALFGKMGATLEGHQSLPRPLTGYCRAGAALEWLLPGHVCQRTPGQGEPCWLCRWRVSETAPSWAGPASRRMEGRWEGREGKKEKKWYPAAFLFPGKVPTDPCPSGTCPKSVNNLLYTRPGAFHTAAPVLSPVARECAQEALEGGALSPTALGSPGLRPS